MKNKIEFIALSVLVAFFLGVIAISQAKADSGPISTQTAFYFQQNGQPVTQPVSFTVECYGTTINLMSGTTSKLLKISAASETCKNYGCKFDVSNIFEVYRGNIQYCNLSGDINGNKFAISDFLSPQMKGLNCHRADFDRASSNKYYKETQQYKDCITNVYKEYYPNMKGGVLGEFMCTKYQTDQYLIPTTISATTNGGNCSGFGYILKNGVCYKSPDEFFNCVNEETRKTNLCDQYLEDVTSKLAKTQGGYPFDQICQANINIPANILTNQSMNGQNAEAVNVFTRTLNYFKCFFSKLFGKSC